MIGAGLLMTGLLTACATDFENLKDDIYAERPATVRQHWFASHSGVPGKVWASGYMPFLLTEDCKHEVQPEDGPGVNLDKACKLHWHETSLRTYDEFKTGDPIDWKDDRATSEVQDKTIVWRSTSSGTVYAFALLIEQCLDRNDPSQSLCVEDYVPVNADTYYGTTDGQSIAFGGRYPDKVSQ